MSNNMIIARIYLSEKYAHLDTLLSFLHDVEKVRGVTVYRAIEGYGDSGELHNAKVIDLSMNLPLVVEFFDEADKVDDILTHVENNFSAGHIISWPIHVRR